MELAGAGRRPDASAGVARGTGSTRADRGRGQLIALGALILITFVAGLALGAFDGRASEAPRPEPAPAPAPTPAQAAALAAAERSGGLALLPDDALVAGLDELIAERRADLAPIEPPVAPPEPAAEVPADPPPTTAAAPSPPPRTAPPPATPAPRPTAPRVAPPEAAPVPTPAPAEPAPTPAEPAPTPAELAPTPAESAPTPGESAEPAPASEGDPTAALADGAARAKEGDWKGAVAAYTRAIAVAPRDAKALAGRGLAYYELRQVDAAVKDLEAVIARHPTHATALLTLGSIAQERGQRIEARGYYERYLRRYPNGRRAAEVTALLENL